MISTSLTQVNSFSSSLLDISLTEFLFNFRFDHNHLLLIRILLEMRLDSGWFFSFELNGRAFDEAAYRLLGCGQPLLFLLFDRWFGCFFLNGDRFGFGFDAVRGDCLA